MNALTLNQLLDHETQWDAALLQVLQPLGLPVHIGNVTEKLEAPYIAGFFTFLGEAPAVGGSGPQLRGGVMPQRWDIVSFKGRFTIFLVVDRQKVKGNPNIVTDWRGGVRRRFLPREQAFNPTTLPYYELRNITLAGGERTIDEARDLDETSFVYEFEWAIVPGAWPS